jgi:hypothetical protein
MKTWVSVKDRMPPDEWCGLVITDVRKDRPVFAHRSNEWYRKEFPYAPDFSGRWRESILIGNHMREGAKVIYWLEIIDDELYPTVPE